MIEAAELEYEQQFDYEPMSFVEAIHNMSATEFYGWLTESVTEHDMPYGDLKMLVLGMADELENYNEPSTGFNVRAGALMWAAMQRGKEAVQ